ncbi:glutamate-1-semialdehyde 2,1-aminomutase [Candidatus Hakubella thermalkaliphila]|uniref:Glutamate-1-semialdehyde 2,1-aminomutase n=1 Tax=Candidatus Hakubella thermalkaliphila TaxID=2754717 RepID=A0A6V8NW29_9ACTN|nr:glutamate-1-semialdehyde 2,1-aminomutase [Candidatus Hakubella thermalkaliphila]
MNGMRFQNSKQLYQKACQHIPGGVNSPVRAFKSVGMKPLFISRGQGSRIYDVDGNQYIDYVCSWGPLILGHAHPQVVQALKKVVENGTSFGAPTELEVRLAEKIRAAYPSVELVRMVNSGTEATMSAIRLARGYTRRPKVVKFEGCYHGHVDSLLVRAGSGVTTLGLPDSPGVNEGASSETIVLPYNDIELVVETIEREHDQIACVIVEPVAGNMGVVLPREGFLETLREMTHLYDIVLIFDEVMTGFRVAYGGAQQLYGVKADLTCLGKIIGGGLPVGAFGGKKEIMEQVAPLGPVYQAGTLSGNPVAMTAGLVTLEILEDPAVYQELEQKTRLLCRGLREGAAEAGIAVFQTQAGSMGCLFFTEEEVYDYSTAKTSDTKRYAQFFQGMLSRGIYLAPSQFEACFISLAHSEEDILRTTEAGREVFKELE